ncbi:MAG TPA: CAAX prenyl protease-related protein [Terriglobia bacterium]|jgi:hypothetical protein
MQNDSVVAFVLPFALYLIFLGLRIPLHADAKLEYSIRICVVSAAILVLWRKKGSWRPNLPLSSIVLGVGVFAIWIMPDLVWVGYRSHWLFQNSLMGRAESSQPQNFYADWWFLSLRVFGSIVVVPIIEELFWRGWLMRYIIDGDFQKVPIGTFRPFAFIVTALLFASEHGAFWDVGLAAGLAYNWWIVRSRNLTDCIIAHSVTNACLAAYVIGFHQWQYWL